MIAGEVRLATDNPRAHLTIFVVEDDKSVRDALCMLLEERGYITARFADAESFLRAYDDTAGCLLTDIRLPGMSGLKLQEALIVKGAKLPVIIITAHGDMEAARIAFRAGAVDFLEKPISTEDLINAIEAAFSREFMRLDTNARNTQRDAAFTSLSPREREVLDLVLQGRQSREIGDELGVSHRTVELHKSSILKKLDARSMLDVVRTYSGLPDSPPRKMR